MYYTKNVQMNYHLSIIALQEEQKRKKKEDGDEKGAKFVGRVKGKNAKEDKKFNIFLRPRCHRSEHQGLAL